MIRPFLSSAFPSLKDLKRKSTNSGVQILGFKYQPQHLLSGDVMNPKGGQYLPILFPFPWGNLLRPLRAFVPLSTMQSSSGHCFRQLCAFTKMILGCGSTQRHTVVIPFDFRVVSLAESAKPSGFCRSTV